MKWLKGTLIFCFSLYALGCLVLFLIQEKIIFNPHELPESHRFRMGEEIEIDVSDEVSLNTLWMKEPNAKGLIIYWHGNKGNLRRCSRQAEMVAGNDYDLLIPDYRGYGKSDGYIYSESQLLEDAQKVYDWAVQHYNCLLYTSPSPRDRTRSRMPSSA